jgi:hypothetical protein
LNEADVDSRRSERQQLLGGEVVPTDVADEDLDDQADDAGGRRPYGSAGPEGDNGRGKGSVQELDRDESQAQEAVEAARHDIQALRARLREVTERLTDTPRPPTAEPGTPGGATT